MEIIKKNIIKKITMEKKIMYGHHFGVDSYRNKLTSYEVIKETAKQVIIILPNGRIVRLNKAGKLFNSMEEAVEYVKNRIQLRIDCVKTYRDGLKEETDRLEVQTKIQEMEEEMTKIEKFYKP